MLAHRNVTRDIWRAVVVAGAMLGTGAGCSAAPRPAMAEPESKPTPVPAEEATGEKRELGTGSALGESTPPPASASSVIDAGVPAAPPPDAAPEPAKRPRSEGGRPKGRGFIIA
jgi:hypothetical protein